VQHQEALFAFSEFAVGLAGFSAIVVAIGYRGGNWDEATRFIFRILLFNTVGAGLFALFPVALFSTGLSEESVWRISSATYLLSIIIFLWFFYTLPDSLRGDFGMTLLRVGQTVALIVSAGLLVNVLGLLHPPHPAPYLVSLFVFLASGAVNFVRVVFRRPGSAA
jgi:hypothetical protein